MALDDVDIDAGEYYDKIIEVKGNAYSQIAPLNHPFCVVRSLSLFVRLTLCSYSSFMPCRSYGTKFLCMKHGNHFLEELLNNIWVWDMNISLNDKR